MAEVKITSHLDLSGPFFERNPSATMSTNIRALLEEVAGQLQTDVVQQFRQGEGGRQPIRALGGKRTADFIRGRVESLSGNRWHYHAVVSPDKTGLDVPGSIALYAAAAQVEKRIHAFSRTARALRRQKTNLTKDLE